MNIFQHFSDHLSNNYLFLSKYFINLIKIPLYKPFFRTVFIPIIFINKKISFSMTK